MANDKKSEKGLAAAESEPVFRMPEGSVKVQEAERFYWFPYLRADGQPAIQISDVEKAKANPLHCEVLLRQERHDSPNEKGERQFFYLVKLLQPAKVVDRDKVVHTKRAGEVVVVDERHQLQMLYKFLSTPKTVEAVIVPKGKIEGGKNSVLVFDIHAIPTDRAAMRLPDVVAAKALPPAESAPAPSDDIPFS